MAKKTKIVHVPPKTNDISCAFSCSIKKRCRAVFLVRYMQQLDMLPGRHILDICMQRWIEVSQSPERTFGVTNGETGGP